MNIEQMIDNVISYIGMGDDLVINFLRDVENNKPLHILEKEYRRIMDIVY